MAWRFYTALGSEKQVTGVTNPTVTTSALSGGPPASPKDGDLWIATGVGGQGQRWMFQYDSAEGTAYKWKFVGGPRVKAGNASGQNTVDNTWQNVGSISQSVVRAGHYIVEFGAMLETTNTGDQVYVGVSTSSSGSPLGGSNFYKQGSAAGVAEWSALYGVVDTSFDVGTPLSAASSLFFNMFSNVHTNVGMGYGWFATTPIKII
jgi:hypothetical protein